MSWLVDFFVIIDHDRVMGKIIKIACVIHWKFNSIRKARVSKWKFTTYTKHDMQIEWKFSNKSENYLDAVRLLDGEHLAVLLGSSYGHHLDWVCFISLLQNRKIYERTRSENSTIFSLNESLPNWYRAVCSLNLR